MKTYYPALDILRFAAATMVLLGHVEFVLNFRWMEGFMPDSMEYEIGKAGVAIFFALSGFLLAKIAIEEKESEAGFNVKQFFKNRALRILPLYYFVTLISFFVLTRYSIFYIENETEELNEFLSQKLMLYLTLIPQFNNIIFKERVTIVVQFWTIGSEVIFYILLPFLMLVKKPLQLMIKLFVAFALLKFASQLLSGKTEFEEAVSILYQLMFMNRIDCLLVGSIAALMFHKKHKWALSLSSRDNMIFGTGLIVIMLFLHRRIITGFDYTLYSAAIIPYLLYFTSGEQKQTNNFFLKALAFGGRISYSIYLTHFIVLMVVCYLLYNYTLLHGDEFKLALYVIGAISVYLVSSLTYYIIERPFLRLKNVVR